MNTDSRRVWSFVVLCLVAIILAGGYAARALRSVETSQPAAIPRLAVPPNPPYLLVRSTASDDSFRRLVAAPLAAVSEPGYVTLLECERVYFAADRGVCLTVEFRGVTSTHLAHIFDERFTRLHSVELTGLPSRTRVSPDGSRAGITVFEHGHSYADEGFSTRTTIVDTATGRLIGDLEQFTVTRDGVRFKAVDFNFWGLTFQADSNKFYATLATGGTIYLIEGNIDAKTARVIRAGVECPSLSPDNTRIVYKSRISRPTQGIVWQLRVFNLQSGTDMPLTRETQSVDDQVDWLDNDYVLYHITGGRGADIWKLRVDDSQPPAILRQYSYSPSVVR